MPLNLTKPAEGDVGWAADVNQNFTDIETRVNALGTLADQNASAVAVTGGTITGITDLAVADGGTGASDATTARANLGLGSIATQAATSVAITGGAISGIADLAIADGGTGASTASDARVALGVAIGADVQAYDAELSALAGLDSAADRLPYFTGAGAASLATFSAFARTLIDDADDGAARTTLGAAATSHVHAAADVTSGTLDAARLPTIAETKGGTNQTTYAAGDILYASGANTLAKLAAGTNGHVLTLASGAPSWAAPSGGGGSGGKLVQEVRASTSSVVTCSTIIPYDNSIPQNTEGTEVLTATITPTNASNYLVVEFYAFGGITAIATMIPAAALFQDSTAGALSASHGAADISGDGGCVYLRHYMLAGTTSATTFKVRAGCGLGTFYVNGNNSGNRRFGGIAATNLIVREVEA